MLHTTYILLTIPAQKKKKKKKKNPSTILSSSSLKYLQYLKILLFNYSVYLEFPIDNGLAHDVILVNELSPFIPTISLTTIRIQNNCSDIDTHIQIHCRPFIFPYPLFSLPTLDLSSIDHHPVIRL